MSSKSPFIDSLNQREPGSFKELFRRHYSNLLNYSLHFLPCQSDGEDVIQDVVVELWQGNASFQHEAQLLGYLFKGVRNRSLSALRRRRRFIGYGPIAQEQIAQEGSENFWDLNSELLEMFDQSLGQLPIECRKIFSHPLNGLSAVDIASKLNRAPSTVRSQKRRGISIMREFVREQELCKEIIDPLL